MSRSDTGEIRYRRGGRSLAVLLLAVAAFFAWNHFRGGARSATAARVSSPVAVPVPAPHAATTAMPVANGMGPAHLDRIVSLGQLIRQAKDASPAMRAQALAELQFAALVCQNLSTMVRVRTQRELTGRMRAEELASLNWQRGFHQRFCDGPEDLLSDVSQQMIDERDANQDVYRAMGLALLEGDEVEQVGLPQARKLLASGQADAVERAAQFLQAQGQDVVAISDGQFPTQLDTPKNRQEVQWLAVQLAGCRMRGGCGPGGLYTASWCVPDCAQGRSLQEAWRHKYSPELLDLALRLSAQLGSSAHANP